MSEKIDQAIHAAATVASAPASTVPPATVAAVTFMGYSPNEWLVWLSILWILTQFTFLIVDRIIRWRRMKKDR